jgi:NADP-dependent 3-hydroxy acid dehydrogenase YdfG
MNKKTLLIFGGTKGIGKALAEDFQPNYNICICGRTAENVETSSFLSLSCDATNEYEVHRVIVNTLLKFSTIDAVINSAGIVLLKPFLEYTVDDMNAIFDTNIKGACLLSKAIIPIFQNQKMGRIIHLGSTRSFSVAPNKSMYAMSKFALRALNLSINLEFNKDGIYSSMVCPGRVDITGTNPVLVSPKDIIQAVEKIISLPNNMNIEEIIIGGQI